MEDDCLRYMTELSELPFYPFDWTYCRGSYPEKQFLCDNDK